ncbi:MAG: hypothetical protein AB1521_04190 [Bacteroidota bacterium]
MKIFISIIIFFFSVSYGQIKETIKRPLSDSLVIPSLETDSSVIKPGQFPILKLKYELPPVNIFSKHFLSIHAEDVQFTLEERMSGLSRDQLHAYKKNKETLMKILSADYEERWWYHVKGIDELLGVPKEVIWALEFAMMYLLK